MCASVDLKIQRLDALATLCVFNAQQQAMTAFGQAGLFDTDAFGRDFGGIDQALWDIKGKVLGVPVSQLLGGNVRDRIRVYSWIGGDRPSDTADAAKAAVARGFTAVKMNGTEELQFIDTYDKVERWASVRVRALDRDGQPFEMDCEGLAAVCVQHEMDHLMGKVFVEYLSPLKRNRIKTKMIKAQREEER